MDNMDKIQKEIARGKQAQALLENEMLKEAFDYLEKEYHTAWENSSIEQQKPRETVFMMLKTLKTVKQHIENVIATGKIANDQLTKIN